MTKGVWLLVFGVVIFLCGAVSHLVNPGPVPVALMWGAVGGGLVAMLGVLSLKGAAWAIGVGRILTVIYLMLAIVLATRQWMALKDGAVTMLTPVLTTVVVIMAVATLRELLSKKA